jgi:ankyrin repeat protein
MLCAALRGFTSIVKYLVEHCNGDVNQGDVLGFLPLFFASQNGHAETVEYLISQGAEVDKTNVTGVTSLYTASLYGHMAVVELLVAHGAAVDKICSQGLTALFAAAWKGDVNVVAFLVDRGADWNKSPTEGERGGWTPLHAAARQMRTEALKYLMEECGADVDARTAETAWMGNMTPSEVTNSDEVRQAIENERARRCNHTYKRPRVEDLLPMASADSMAGGEDEAEEEEDDDDDDDDEDEDDDDDEER